MTDKEIATRLRRLEDREEIRVLVALYSKHVDDHDFSALATLWAPDARYSWKDSPDVTIGGEKVAALLKSRIEPTGPSFHVNHDHVIEFGDDPDHATGLVCAHAETSGPTGQNMAAIRYHDRYVRHGGQWKFAERALAFLYFTPVGDYHEIMRAEHRMRLPNGKTLLAHWPTFQS
ncbi:nuclear transport factor 2 family protein [Aquamicrobium sp. LC103]|uniref:nuclear transport factor 2 family protein n=1 Tax=Aquamicrobium sp. LC103 TaxID=1120658 RepID=UPI00069A74D4|nr:nuclear transport factor 2 family protein [Aquamicrobium sp. LC103]